jgi:hypothetical protein
MPLVEESISSGVSVVLVFACFRLMRICKPEYKFGRVGDRVAKWSSPGIRNVSIAFYAPWVEPHFGTMNREAGKVARAYSSVA